MRIIDRGTRKIKGLARHARFDDAIWIAVIVAVALGAFSIGVLYERGRYLSDHPVTVTYSDEATALWDAYQNTKEQNQSYVASKNGSLVYPVGCARANTLSDANKVFFETLEQAIEFGYREAEGC